MMSMTNSPNAHASRFARSALGAVLLLGFLATAGESRAQDAALIAAAKAEGSVTWYTTQIIDQFARPAAEAFQKKYGIRVDYLRADSNDVALRVLNEGKSGRMLADVFDGTAAVASLKKEGLVMQWIPDGARRLPANAMDKDRYWVATNLYAYSPGYNTDLIAPGAAPKTLQDLLAPSLKGHMVWNAQGTPSGAGGFVGLVLTSMGEEPGKAYLRELAKQNITGLRAAARQVLDQVIAGEYALALNMVNNHPVISAQKGAPVDWIPMSPTLSVFSAASATKDAPHPNAAKLLLEFLVSPEGQRIYRDADYLPIDPAVAPKDPALRPNDTTYKAVYLTPEQIHDNMPRWMTVFQDIFR
jgi:ABC-type Fe3+ transport system substrate-binding protein